MPRIVEVTVPVEKTDSLLREVKNLPEYISLRVEKNISVQPPGDVVTVTITDKVLPQLLQVMDKLGITQSTASSITTSHPSAVISSSSANAIRGDSSHTVWEEVDQELNKESSMTSAMILVMLTAGVIAQLAC